MMTVETPEAPASLAAPKQSAGRTGRPKIWNGERSRKLTRLYVYTLLTIDDIMKLLQDSVFKPKFVPRRSTLLSARSREQSC